MKRFAASLIFMFALATAGAHAQDVKLIADTLTVQADGQYEADPDLATLSFHISSQEKEMRTAYEKASQSMHRILDVASKNGLKKDEISTGALTVMPMYEGDRNRKTRAYRVDGDVVLRVHDFSTIGALIDDSVQDGITDFRSLTYSLADVEAAKKEAVANAMRRAVDRATIALKESGQRLGALRFASVDVSQIVGLATFGTSQTVEVKDSWSVFAMHKVAPPPPPPPVQPGKITVAASVQCAFQIQ